MDRAADLSAVSAVKRVQAPARDRASVAGPPRAAVADLGDVIRRAQGGDEEAFRLLYRDLQPRLLRYLRALVGDDADDVASETWLHIARGLGGFEGDSDGFRGWTATIARNRATDHIRHNQRRAATVAVPIEEFAGLAASDDTADSAIEGLSTDAAIALIARLPRDQAEAVLLRVTGFRATGTRVGRRWPACWPRPPRRPAPPSWPVRTLR